VAAARREIREEAGLAAAIVAPWWLRRLRLRIGGVVVDQVERYFLVRIAADSPPVAGTIREDIVELRWWSLAQLRSWPRRSTRVPRAPGSRALRRHPGRPIDISMA
jgi:8-oxo-dGTP pyrophosphatase MutT (NUDIX family)